MTRLYLIGILFCMSLVFSSFNPHPYHVGSMEFNYNARSQTFEISGKFFIDDLENALNRKYNSHLQFNNAQQKEEMNFFLKKYAAEYLKLKVNSQFVTINYLGYEEDGESVDLYLESVAVSKPQKVETAVSFLYNLFDDQINIIHIVVNGNRKTSKLSFPNRYLYQQF